MRNRFEFKDDTVTLSKCGRYGQFSNGRWANVRIEDDVKYVVKEHFRENGCTKRNPSKYWLAE